MRKVQSEYEKSETTTKKEKERKKVKKVKKNDYFANIGEKVLTECVKNSNIRYRKATNYRIEINQYLNMIGYEIPHDFIYRK